MKTQGNGNGLQGRGAQRGSALVMSLVAVATVVVLSASFSQFASAVANRQAQAVNRKRAFYLAEAGLAEGFAGLTCSKSGIVGSLEAPALLGDGVFWVEAVELGEGVVRLESNGMVGTGRAQLSLVARRGEEGVASLGLFSTGPLTLAEGSLIDAYDSSKSVPYSAQLDKSGASVGSNDAIQITGSSLDPTTILGDVTPGTESSVETIGSVTISGSTSPSFASIDLPAVVMPELTMGAALAHSSPYPLVIPPGQVAYQGLAVKTDAQVIIQGPATVVLGSLALQAGAELVFDTTQGSIELFVTDGVALAEGSVVTTTGTQPEDVRIQVPSETTEPLEFRATGPFYGVIYAPEAALVVGGGFETFGALIAGSLIFDGPAKLHFDRHLARLAAEEALPAMFSWRIVELSSASSNLSSDPFSILGLDKNLLPVPSGAHAEQTLAIDYYDASSVYHRYVGDESAFDWNVVKTVISATRDGVEVTFPRATAVKVGPRKSPGVLPILDGPMI